MAQHRTTHPASRRPALGALAAGVILAAAVAGNAAPVAAGEIVVTQPSSGAGAAATASRTNALRAKQYADPGEAKAEAQRLFIQRGTDDRPNSTAARLNALRAADAAEIDPEDLPDDAVIVVIGEDGTSTLTDAELNALKARQYREGDEPETERRILVIKSTPPPAGTAEAASVKNRLILNQAREDAENNPATTPTVVLVDPEESDGGRRVMIVSDRAKRARTDDEAKALPRGDKCAPASSTLFGILDDEAGGKSNVVIRYKDAINLDTCR